MLGWLIVVVVVDDKRNRFGPKASVMQWMPLAGFLVCAKGRMIAH
jgi:hypothetical protein